jgi:outer membrane protein assembly factor BamE (lipoprotein component of BamABCDE complex)
MLKTGTCIALLLVLACAAQGRRFNVDAIPLITPGVTTQARVVELFGKPTSMRVRSSGRSNWRYIYQETTTRDTGTFTKIGRAVGSILGKRTYYPPVDVRYSNTTRHTLNIEFNPSGTVLDYTYEVKETPTHQVY